MFMMYLHHILCSIAWLVTGAKYSAILFSFFLPSPDLTILSESQINYYYPKGV